MTEKLTWDAEVIDHASAVLDKIAKSAEVADKKVGGFTEGNDEATKSTSALGGATTGMGGAMAGATALIGAGVVAVAALTAGIAAAYSITMQLTDAFQEQDDVERRLLNSIQSTGAANDDLASSYDTLIAVANDYAIKTNSGDEANIAALATLQSLTPATLSQAEAERALSTILGIATVQKKGAEDAAKLYAKAQKGEVSALAEVLPLTKSQIEALAKITNESKRAEMATKLLEDRYAGAGENITGFYAASKNLTDALGDTQQALGRVIVESGALDPIIELVTEGLWDLQNIVGDNEEAWGEWLRNGVATGVDYMVKFLQILQDGSPILAGIIGYVKAFSNVWQIHIQIIEIVGRAIAGLVTTILGGIIDVLEPIRGIAVKFAGYIDEDLGKAFDGAKTFIDDAGESLTKFGATQFDGIDSAITGISTDIGDIVQAFKDMPEIDAQISGGLNNLLGRLDGVSKKLRDADANLKKTGTNAGPGGADTSAAAKGVAAIIESMEWRNKLAAIDRDLAIERNDLLTIRLDRKRAEVVLEQDIANKKVTAVEIEARQAQIQRTYEDSIAALRLKRIDERAAAESAAHDARMKQLEDELKSQTAFFDSIRNIAGAVGGPVGGALDGLLSQTDQIVAGFRQMRAEGMAAGTALAASLSAGGGAAFTFLEKVGLSYEQLAGVRAGFEFAAGLAAAASFNAPAALGHFAASAAFGGVAATGAGGGASASTGGGADASAGPQQGVDTDSIYRAQRKAYVDAFRETQGNAGVGETYIFTGNTFLEKNTAAQRDVKRLIDGADRLRAA